jgi:hypothetical protein
LLAHISQCRIDRLHDRDGVDVMDRTILICIGIVALAFYYFWQGAGIQADTVINACETTGSFTYEGSKYFCAKQKEEKGDQLHSLPLLAI